MREEDIPTLECFLCSKPFKYGFHFYEGRSVPQLAMNLCRDCENSNWDGIIPSERITKHLRDKGIQAPLNKNGWIDIPPIGSKSN